MPTLDQFLLSEAILVGLVVTVTVGRSGSGVYYLVEFILSSTYNLCLSFNRIPILFN